MTMQRLIAGISLFAGGLLASGTVAMNSCEAQKSCMDVRMTQVSYQTCPGSTRPSAGCVWEICLRFKPGCAASTISYSCEIGDICAPVPILPPSTMVENYVTSDWQCRNISDTFQTFFYFQDQAACSGTGSIEFPVDEHNSGRVRCSAVRDYFQSCDPNYEKPTPCMWQICECPPGSTRRDGECKNDAIRCICDNGVVDPAYHDRCEKDGAAERQCMSCDDGYVLKTVLEPTAVPGSTRRGSACELKSCSCALGTPTSGTSCPGDALEDCVSCLPGNHLVEIPNSSPVRKTCQVDAAPVKTCDCPNGVPVDSATCTTSGTTECESCDLGFEMKSGSKECTVKPPLPPVCTCPYGEAAKDDACAAAIGQGDAPENGNSATTSTAAHEVCASCESGDPDAAGHCQAPMNCDGDLSGSSADVKSKCCQMFGKGCDKKCRCNDGEEARDDDCPEADKLFCVACDIGFVLQKDDGSGEALCNKECACNNGEGATGAACPSPGQQLCATCDDGFYLDVTGTCKAGAAPVKETPKLCTCANGRALTGDMCPAAGQEACDVCSTGFTKVGNECKEVATCQAGFHAIGTTCVEDCICRHGVTMDQEHCTTGGLSMCRECIPGFELVFAPLQLGQTFCEYKTCHCDFGAPTTGSACPARGAKDCASCISGYDLSPIGSDGAHWCKKAPTSTDPNVIGTPDLPVCSCPNGHAATGSECTVDGSTTCMVCNTGYVKNADGHCEIEAHHLLPVTKVCTCSHGTPNTGADCPADGQESCKSCDFGAVKSGTCEAQYVCFGSRDDWGAEKKGWCCEKEQKGCDEVQKCTCPHGQPALGDECPPLGISVEACRSCDDGYVLASGFCQQECFCANGQPAVGLMCPSIGSHVCSFCDEGYLLNPKGICEERTGEKVCRCPYGTALEECDNLPFGMNGACSACDDLYELKSGVCQAIKPAQGCTCTHGEPKDDGECPAAGEHACKSCGAGFHMVDKHCLPDVVTGSGDRKACTCTGGEAAIGGECPTEGAEACKGCSAGFKFVSSQDAHWSYGTCAAINPDSAKACTCKGGAALSATACPAAGTEACAECNDGYEFVAVAGQTYGTCKEEKQKVCHCPGGMPAVGPGCPHRGMEACASCSDGFELVGFQCIHVSPGVGGGGGGGSIESMPPIAPGAGGVAVDALGNSELPDAIGTRTTTIAFVALAAIGIFFVVLFVGVRTWMRSHQYSDDRTVLLSDLAEIENKDETA